MLPIRPAGRIIAEEQWQDSVDYAAVEPWWTMRMYYRDLPDQLSNYVNEADVE